MFDNVIKPINDTTQVIRYEHHIIDSIFLTVTPGSSFLLMIVILIILNTVSIKKLRKFFKLNIIGMENLMNW